MTRMEDFGHLFSKQRSTANMTEVVAVDDSASIRSSSSSISSENDYDSDSSGLSVSSSNDSDDDDDHDESFKYIIHDKKNKKRCDDHDDDGDDDYGKENKMPSTAAATSCSGNTVASDISKLNNSDPNFLLSLEDNNSILPLDAAASLVAENKQKKKKTTTNEANDDDDDLVEIFSRSSPIHYSVTDNKTITVSRRSGKKTDPCSLLHHHEEHSKPFSDRCVGDNDDGDEDGEQQPLSMPTAPASHHDFDSLDKDALAELDEDDSVHEEDGRSGVSVVDDGATISMAEVEEEGTTITPSKMSDYDNFIITYNCEKKECATVDEELLDSSDDDNYDEDYVDFENILARRKKVFRSNNDVDDFDDSQQQRDQSNVNMEKSRSGSPTSSLDTPREMESPSRDHSPHPPSASPRLTTHAKKTCNLQPTTRSGLAKTTNSYQSKPIAIAIRQDKDSNSLSQPKNTSLLDMPEEVSLESPRALLPRSSTNNVTASVSNNSTKDAATTSATGVVTLPDIGLNPDVHMSELQRFGIDHSHTAPPPCISHPNPIIHKFNNQNRPYQSRRNIAVEKIFSSPVNNLWKKSNKFHSFNHLQSEMVNVLANSDDNVIVSAPTGAGKTVLFEMAMARLLASNIHRRGGGGGVTVSKAQKILYLAPNKALCEERQLDWSKRLVDIDRGIICTTITGGPNTTSPSTSFADIASSHLIITTTEKWDSITRRWNEQFVLLSSIKLVLVDEVHMIGEPDRGGCLESVICRMKTIQRVARSKMLTGLDIASSR